MVKNLKSSMRQCEPKASQIPRRQCDLAHGHMFICFLGHLPAPYMSLFWYIYNTTGSFRHQQLHNKLSVIFRQFAGHYILSSCLSIVQILIKHGKLYLNNIYVLGWLIFPSMFTWTFTLKNTNINYWTAKTPLLTNKCIFCLNSVLACERNLF